MKTHIILAMHGAPPLDFPRAELQEFFSLHARMESPAAAHGVNAEASHRELDEKMKHWPRTAQNDPYHGASCELAQALSQETGHAVTLTFNEFCAPGIAEGFATAASASPEKIIVVTNMLTRGGEHAEKEIAQEVARARQKYPEVEIIYAWPYKTEEIARFLTAHIQQYLQ
jgi:sirohydrochlorin cobaltochelatase